MKRIRPIADFETRLAELESSQLRRWSGPRTAPDGVSFCSNDYLGLASRAAVAGASGAGASRLISGDCDEHEALEVALAGWLGVDAALVFSSGYAANVGTLEAIAGRGDLIVSDALNHASLIDGARLSRARVVVVPHNDAESVERVLAERAEGRAWVVVESYYSMDADGPDLAALRRACDLHCAGLFVDEAHALGVLGPGGRGRCAEADVRPDILVGTLGKAFGSQGAFAAGPAVLREWLWNRARSFVFSTGLAPVSAAGALHALHHLLRHPELLSSVRTMAERLRAGVLAASAARPEGAAALPTLLGFGHIVPVVVRTPSRALRLAELLRSRGVDVHAIRPPTVPEGSARIRLTITARHTEQDVDRAIDAYVWATATLLAEETAHS